MIKIYSMKTCLDCKYIYPQVENDHNFQVIDIGEHVRLLKEFLRLRDNNAAFNESRKHGYVGIPCFVREDGSVTLRPEDVGLKSRPLDGTSCNIDGSGC